MTTVGQCDLNVHEDSKKTKETTSYGNTNVFTQRRTKVTSTSKTIVAVVGRALATQERGIDVGSVASCRAVATVAVVGQINAILQELVAHQGRVFSTQTSTGKSTTFKGSIVVVASGPSKFGLDPVPSDVSNAGGTDGAPSAVPIFWVGGGVVEVVELVAVGWFCKAVVLAQT
jgi:hypothetical protein